HKTGFQPVPKAGQVGNPSYGRGTSFSDAELMQNRSPVGRGLSSNTCPRWASHRLHTTSVRTIRWLVSVRRVIASRSRGSKKLGHPQPESNLFRLSNRGCPQQTQAYTPSA